MKTIIKLSVCFLTVALFTSFVYRSDNREQLTRDFLQCSINEGDLGCDSCYFRVYGKLIDTYTCQGCDTIKVTNENWIKSHNDYLNGR